MRLTILSLILLFGLGSEVYAQSACPAYWCEQKKQQIGTICHSNPNGNLVYIPSPGNPDVWCYCLCSCVASDTPVQVSASTWKPIGEIKVGEKVLALQRDGKWVESEVIFSDGTQGVTRPQHYAIYVTLENGAVLISTADHIYLMPDGKLRRADRLAPGDSLTSDKKKPVKITRLLAGDYLGAVHNIAVGKWNNQTPEIDGHFINTKGVISGDFYIQSIIKDTQDVGRSLPQIGSRDYVTKYKAMLGNEQMLGISSVENEIKISSDNSFVPYKTTVIPATAVSYLPREYEEAAPGLLEPLDNSVPYEVAEYMVYNYKRFYGNVVYHIDWADDTVNAYAWMQGNTRHVALKGGLIRHRFIQQEGVGLILAHELGHHYAGLPRYPNNPWASCEGQSDYWGALVAQRNVWWGQEALNQISKGSQQVYNLFAYGLRVGNLFMIEANRQAVAGICTHPPASCRLATYRAGLFAEPKPSCAGDPPGFIGSNTIYLKPSDNFAGFLSKGSVFP